MRMNLNFCHKIKFPFLLFILLNIVSIVSAQKISINETDATVTLTNDLVSFTFSKNNADITQISYKKYSNLLGSKGRGYLWGAGFSMFPAVFSIVRSNDSLVEIAFYHEASNHFQYDLHYILRSKVSGIYSFLYQTHKGNDSLSIYGQTSWGISADKKLLNYPVTMDSARGTLPLVSSIDEKVQDNLSKMHAASPVAKADYANYIDSNHVFGFAGTKSGIGMFIIQASHEYLNCEPAKQFLNIHSVPYLINQFNNDPFLSDKKKEGDSIKGRWAKMCGPFFLYLNSGNDVDKIWKDAKQRAALEAVQWPYSWMVHPDYPLSDGRGELSGKLKIINGGSAAYAHILLAASGKDWHTQSKGYIFTTTADSRGFFIVKNIRPGRYCLYANIDGVAGEFVKDKIEIISEISKLLGTLTWTPVSNNDLKPGQIGVAGSIAAGVKIRDNSTVNYTQNGYALDSLLLQDNFVQLQPHWIIETNASNSNPVIVQDRKLVIDVNGGATVWLKEKLPDNILIECKRKVIMQDGKNDRLSDFNFFWMATDLKQPDLFTRRGVFSEYDSLQLYYIGIGGNHNTTTRFRKYEGNGDRTLLKEYIDKPHLLIPNKEYCIRIVVKEGVTTCWVDDEIYCSYKDPHPLSTGYFAFRTTQSRQEIYDFKVFKVK